MGTIVILTSRGDERLDWDPKDEASTRKAKAEFDRLRKEGYEFYEVAEARGKRVTRWDKKAGKLLAAPGAQSAADRRAGSRPRAMAGGPVTGIVP